MADVLETIRAALAAQYRVDRELGHGGMATVFLAEDLKHRRPVAIKVLDPDLAGLLGPERFLREIEIAAGLQHPHILPLLNSGSSGGLLYYVMPFVEGQSLRARLDAERQLGQGEAVRLAVEIARALDYAHRRGMVHRDIKPENILLADGQAMVADFGIARAIGEAGGARLTQTGVTLGSPPYMSPEQIAGRREVDARADLYALGCVLYEMLAGQPPFTGPAETLAHQHLNLTPRPVRELRTTVSPAVDAAVSRCLAKAPGDRFASAAEFAAALGEAASATTASAGAATVPQPAAPLRTPATRPRPRRVAVFAALAVVVLAATGFALWRSGVLGGPPPASGESRRWVWLADFEGPGSDPALAPAARDLVAAALDQSQILAAVPVEQVRAALRNSGRPETTAVAPDLARELAFRSAIPVVLEGRVARLGGSYSIVLRATQSRDASAIQTASGQAASDRDLIPALTRLAREIRQGLGERSDAFRERESWTDAPTPSFQAFKLYLQGRDLINANESPASIALLRQATALDPEFAAAWAGIGTAFGNMGQEDSALVAHQRALQYPHRLTSARRFDIEGKIASLDGNVDAQIAAYEAILRSDPSPSDRALALNNKGVALSELGLHAQALELYRQSVEAYPVEAPPLNFGNLIDELIALNRPDEAREEMTRLKGPRRDALELQLALLERSWERADSLAAARLADPSTAVMPRNAAAFSQISVRALRGSIDEALRLLATAGSGAMARRSVIGGGVTWHTHHWLARLSGREPPAVPAWMASNSWGIGARAATAALAGDSTASARALAEWPASRRATERGMVADHVAGCLDWKRGRWEQVVARLGAHATGGARSQPSVQEILRAPSRWMVADAFARLGRPDSAVTYLHRLLEPPNYPAEHLTARGAWEPFVRSRLVKLHAGMGQLDEARRHWEILSATCTRPDPPVAALLDETRATLQAASGMRAGAGR